MHKTELAGRDIFVIHDFLTAAECADFIARTEAAGYGDAPISSGFGFVMRKDVRNNDRVMIDDAELAAALWPRAEPFVPPNFLHWVPVGLNERFRFYRYHPGQKFDWHFDGAFTRPDGVESSKLTLMVYLNGGCDGGETVFNLSRYSTVRSDDAMLRVSPEAGKALVFRHDVLHTGAVVTSGVKYVLRTDVMYRYQVSG